MIPSILTKNFREEIILFGFLSVPQTNFRYLIINFFQNILSMIDEDLHENVFQSNTEVDICDHFVRSYGVFILH